MHAQGKVVKFIAKNDIQNSVIANKKNIYFKPRI